jgi:hypothetical protein
MATLLIEHPVTELGHWRSAFDRFADVRRRAGVTAERVAHPDDDDHYIVVELDFDDAPAAHAFRAFLATTVWSSREASPALAGTPKARVLEPLVVR